MKSVKLAIAMAVLTAAASVLSPPASAMMHPGNYDVNTNRYERASWTWFVSACPAPVDVNCLRISAAPRLKFYAYYEGYARLDNGTYTMTVDVPDGLQCLPGYAMPTRDTYTWNEVSQAGEINSVYDVGCFNGPPGSQFWTFALQRL